MTQRPHRTWALGVSTAFFDLPLVIVGQGKRWNGTGTKVSGLIDAVRFLDLVYPQAQLLFADASDTFIANMPAALDASSFVVSAECNSFPLCYKSEYEMKIEWFAECRQMREAACFINSGAYIARPALVVVMLQAWLAQMHTQFGVEKNEDQSAMHHMLLSGRFPITVDWRSRTFLSLYRCKGSAFRTFGLFKMCHNGLTNPALHLRARNDKLEFHSHNEWTTPTLIHASGLHTRLNQMVAQYAQHSKLLRALRATNTSLLDNHRVVLLNSVAHGMHHESTLGAIVRGV